jgi:DNA (cytosine-5)-methyltransferase 1
MNPKKSKVPPIPDIRICGCTTDAEDYLRGLFTRIDLPNLSSDETFQRFWDRYGIPPIASAQSLAQLVTEKFCLDVPRCKSCILRYTCRNVATQVSRDTNSPTFADFFCGAGGFSLGLEQVGFQPALALDILPWCIETYRFNRPYCPVQTTCDDISNWLKAPTLNHVDVVTGGVPCQSFSTANRQQADNDPRDSLYARLLAACNICNPKVLVIENVSGMLRVYEDIEADLNSKGYAAQHIILDAQDYYIPQRRRRLIFIAFSREHFEDAQRRSNRAILALGKMKRLARVSLRQAIGDLPSLEPSRQKNATTFESAETGLALRFHDRSSASEYVADIHRSIENNLLFNHKSRFNNDRDINIFSLLAEGEDSLAASIRHLMPYSNRNHIFKDKYYRLSYDVPCRTITAHMRYDCNMYIHPTQPRGLTVREAARVQSYPDDYAFCGTFQSLYLQVGNSVPPSLARKIGEAVLEALN